MGCGLLECGSPEVAANDGALLLASACAGWLARDLLIHVHVGEG